MPELAPPLSRSQRHAARLRAVEVASARINRLQAQLRLELHALAAEDTRFGQVDFVADELALVLAESPGTAGRLLDAAHRFAAFPEVVARVGLPFTQDGWSLRHADAVLDSITGVGLTREQQEQVIALVADHPDARTPHQLRRAATAAVLLVDPEGAARRYDKAKADRHVTTTVFGDGSASLQAVGTVAQIATLSASLDCLAGPKQPGDTRSLAQRRFDALMDLVSGRVQPGSWQALLVVSLETLQGGDAPGEVPGFGLVSAQEARDAAAHADLRRAVVDAHGELVSVDTTVSRPDQPTPAPDPRVPVGASVDPEPEDLLTEHDLPDHDLPLSDDDERTLPGSSDTRSSDRQPPVDDEADDAHAADDRAADARAADARAADDEARALDGGPGPGGDVDADSVGGQEWLEAQGAALTEQVQEYLVEITELAFVGACAGLVLEIDTSHDRPPHEGDPGGGSGSRPGGGPGRGGPGGGPPGREPGSGADDPGADEGTADAGQRPMAFDDELELPPDPPTQTDELWNEHEERSGHETHQPRPTFQPEPADTPAGRAVTSAVRTDGPPGRRPRPGPHSTSSSWSPAAMTHALTEACRRPLDTRPLSSSAYALPPRLARHVKHRDVTCVFPGCPRLARDCQNDHVVAWPKGPSTADNVSSECTHHHQAKHAFFTVTRGEHGTVLWTLPDAEPDGPRTYTRHPRPLLRGW